MHTAFPVLGVIIVTYNSSDVIRDCLETLLAAAGDVVLSVVVVDNASPDTTVSVIEAWADGKDGYTLPADLPFSTTPLPKPVVRALHTPRAPKEDGTSSLHLIQSGVNGGFAAGVNIGLAYLAKDSEIDRFWVLNPDCVVPPGTPKAFAQHNAGRFSLMGGRVTYYNPSDQIQSDGGTINRLTGVTHNHNQGITKSRALALDPDALDFIPGSSMVASRLFLEVAGPMTEDYFLYYEEVDWALRRGDLPLAVCPQAQVYHHAGSSIGSGTVTRIASPFSIYFLYRARLRFMRRFFAHSLPITWIYALAKTVQLCLRGYQAEAWALLSAILGFPPPPPPSG